MAKNKLLKEAQDGLAIQTVDLRSSSISTDPSFSSHTVKQFDEVDVQSRKDFLMMKYFHDENDNAGFLSLEYSLGVRLVMSDKTLGVGGEDSQDGRKVLLEIEANFAANYLINQDSQPAEAAIKAFTEENGLFHIWPYWREYVQSACSRVGVPPIPIDMRPGSVEIDGLIVQDEVKLPTKKQ